MKDDYTTNSRCLTHTSLQKVGRMYFLNLVVKGLSLKIEELLQIRNLSKKVSDSWYTKPGWVKQPYKIDKRRQCWLDIASRLSGSTAGPSSICDPHFMLRQYKDMRICLGRPSLGGRSRWDWEPLKPFTPKSDQCQISPAASPEILHHTVWRTWLFIAY